MATNPAGFPRHGSITVGGQLFTVDQAAGAGNPNGPQTIFPFGGSLATPTFQATFTDAKGARNIKWAQILVAAAPDGGHQSFCFLHYDVQGNGLWLYSDQVGFFMGPVAHGAVSNALQGTLCALNTRFSSANVWANAVTVRAYTVFKDAGPRNIYLRSFNQDAVDSGWIHHGIVMLQPLGALTGFTVNPSSGSGASPTYQLACPDPPGFAGFAFGWVQFLVGVSETGGGQPFCYLHYDRGGNGLWMYSSDVGFFLGPVSPGTGSALLTSSACAINTGATSVTNLAGALRLTVPETLPPPMRGARKLYQRMLDALWRDSGIVQTVAWTIP